MTHGDDGMFPDELSERQRRFVEAYMGEASGNGVKAARLAGYTGDDTTLAVTASRLLRNDKVSTALQARVECDPLVMSRVERLRLLSRIAAGDETEEKLDKEGQVVPMRPSLKERMAAVEALSKAAGEHIKRVEVSGSAAVDLASASIRELLELAKQGGT